MTATMPFGKYRGRRLSTIPDDYLAWLAAIDLRPPLRAAVAEEISRRCGGRSEPPRPSACPSACPSVALATEIINAGYRIVAKRSHPDTGGSHDDMVAASAVVAWLRSRVEVGP